MDVENHGTLSTKKADAVASAFHISRSNGLSHNYNNRMIFTIFKKWDQV